jgi:hypothetical protein
MALLTGHSLWALELLCCSASREMARLGLSNEVGRNVSTGVVRIGGITEPGLNANSLRRICGLSILVYERDA